MKALVGIVISILLSLTILTVVLSMSEEILFKYSEITIEEEYIAIEDLASSEYLELSFEYISLNFVTVNGVTIDLTPDNDIYYFWSDEDTLVLRTNLTDIGDEIIVNYIYLGYGYDDDYSDSTITLVELIPTFILITIISVLVVIVYKKK